MYGSSSTEHCNPARKTLDAYAVIDPLLLAAPEPDWKFAQSMSAVSYLSVASMPASLRGPISAAADSWLDAR
jgi:hypothetical protein